MRLFTFHISMLLVLALVFASCDRTPRGVLSKKQMADLIVDLQLADAYIDTHIADYGSDSSKMVLKQSIFKKHGITQEDYDSSLVWYAHNMEDYAKAYDKAIGKLKSRYEKLDKNGVNNTDRAQDIAGMEGIQPGEPTHNPVPGAASPGPRGDKHLNKRLKTDVKADSTDLWKGSRSYRLTQGARRGFICFELPPDAYYKPGDRYQLAYKLLRGSNEFKVSLCLDYTDGATAQITRGTNSDGWVTIDVQSDTARQVRRIYGYVSYGMKRGQSAYVDSLSLMRTHFNKGNYGFINAQRLLERNK